MYVDYVWDKEDNIFQSVIFIAPKCQNDTLECTLEELIIMKHIVEATCVKQNDLAKMTGKSLSTVKRIMAVLQEKGYVHRANGKRYGKWEVLMDISSNNIYLYE